MAAPNASQKQALKAGIVVIEHAFKKSIRIKPGAEAEANCHGGRGRFARWHLEIIDAEKNLIKFKSKKSGRYLRIIQKGSRVDVNGGGGKFTLFRYDPFNRTLESSQFSSVYLAVKKGDPQGVYAVNRDDLNDNSNGQFCAQFDIHHVADMSPQDRMARIKNCKALVDYQFGISPGPKLVVILSKKCQTLRINPQDETMANGLGGKGQFARWNMVEHNLNINHAANNIVNLQSCKSSKYLRISPKQNGTTTDVQGSGGKYTKFRVHVIKQPNVVALESVVYQSRFLQCDPDGQVGVYQSNGGTNITENCLFTVKFFNKKDNPHHGRRQPARQQAIAVSPVNGSADLIKSQSSLIEQQKTFIDHLQATVEQQKRTIDRLRGSKQGGTNNGTQTTMNDGENDDDDFEYVSSPGCPSNKQTMM